MPGRAQPGTVDGRKRRGGIGTRSEGTTEGQGWRPVRRYRGNEWE